MGTIGDRIKTFRTFKGVTMQQLAAPLHVSEGYISTIEGNKRNPSETLLALFAVKWDVSEAWLRTGEGDMIQPKKAHSVNPPLPEGLQFLFGEIQKVFTSKETLQAQHEVLSKLFRALSEDR